MSARHEAVLEDGRRVVLLDDRGWSEEPRGAGANEVADVLALSSEHDIAATARTVVGPDEPSGGRTRDEMETDHWNTLAEKLGAHGVVVGAGELTRLPHEVVVSEALLARLGRASADAT